MSGATNHGSFATVFADSVACGPRPSAPVACGPRPPAPVACGPRPFLVVLFPRARDLIVPRVVSSHHSCRSPANRVRSYLAIVLQIIVSSVTLVRPLRVICSLPAVYHLEGCFRMLSSRSVDKRSIVSVRPLADITPLCNVHLSRGTKFNRVSDEIA